MIKSYRDKKTESFANGEFVRAFSGFSRQAEKRLEILDAAESTADLAALPSKWKSLITTKHMRDMTMRTPIHPGEILKDELAELGISGAELARQLKVPENRMSEIMRGRRNITADTALRLGKWFGNSASFWLNLQKRYELRSAAQEIGNDIEQIQPRSAAAG